MFSDFAISIYFGIGFGGWIYAKMQRRTGGNFQDSLTVAIGSALVGAMLLFAILQIVF